MEIAVNRDDQIQRVRMLRQFPVDALKESAAHNEGIGKDVRAESIA